jgi:hypothetical protein
MKVPQEAADPAAPLPRLWRLRYHKASRQDRRHRMHAVHDRQMAAREGMVALCNPYLTFFQSLPESFRRDPSVPQSTAEIGMPDWLRLKAAIATHFSWAVPTDQAIGTIASHASRVVEIGCGSGYWAWLMQQAGIAVTAVDQTMPTLAWHPIELGNELASAKHPDKALFLCWPPWGTTMAEQAVANYAGTCVIYVGEWLGGNAEPGFFVRLVRDFDMIAIVPIPQWYMRTDSLMVFKRR